MNETMSGLLRYPCPVDGCDRRFADAVLRTAHIDEVHGRAGAPGVRYLCRHPSRCPEAFDSKAKRDAHEDIGHRRAAPAPAKEANEMGTRYETPQPCGHPGCEFEHTWPPSLAAHRKRHVREAERKVGSSVPVSDEVIADSEPVRDRLRAVDEAVSGAVVDDTSGEGADAVVLTHPAMQAPMVDLRLPADVVQLLVDRFADTPVPASTVAAIAVLGDLRCYLALKAALEGSPDGA